MLPCLDFPNIKGLFSPDHGCINTSGSRLLLLLGEIPPYGQYFGSITYVKLQENLNLDKHTCEPYSGKIGGLWISEQTDWSNFNILNRDVHMCFSQLDIVLYNLTEAQSLYTCTTNPGKNLKSAEVLRVSWFWRMRYQKYNLHELYLPHHVSHQIQKIEVLGIPLLFCIYYYY